jgi:hypothetical protein
MPYCGLRKEEPGITPIFTTLSNIDPSHSHVYGMSHDMKWSLLVARGAALLGYTHEQE